MADYRDFKQADGSIDWQAKRKADIEDGSSCYRCGALIVFGRSGHRAECGDCKELSTNTGNVSHSVLVRCPQCGHTWDPYRADDYSVCEEGEHEMECEVCEHSFDISTRIERSFESPERLPSKDHG